jgi:hypothetical protein
MLILRAKKEGDVGCVRSIFYVFILVFAEEMFLVVFEPYRPANRTIPRYKTFFMSVFAIMSAL